LTKDQQDTVDKFADEALKKLKKQVADELEKRKKKT
jgi:hypothetical protein